MLVAAITLALAPVQTATETIHVQHVRPSVLVKLLHSFYFKPDGTGWPVSNVDDEHGTFTLAGAPDLVRDVKSLISQFDVQRRTVALTLTVDSKIDFLHYQVTSKMPQLEKWSTSEEETKSNFVFTPRVNDDDTVTILCSYQHNQVLCKNLVFRTKAHQPFDLAKAMAQSMPNEKLPQITVEAHPEDQ